MALRNSKIVLNFANRKLNPKQMAIRYAGGVQMPDIKALAQKAIAYQNDKEYLQSLDQNSIQDKSNYLDLQKQLKNIGTQKEDVIREMAYAQTDEQRDFLNQKAKNLDNLLNELKTDLNRTALNIAYLDEVATKKGDLKDSRKDEIALGIEKKPPVVLLSSKYHTPEASPAEPKDLITPISTRRLKAEDSDNDTESEPEIEPVKIRSVKKGKASKLSEASTRRLEDEAEEVARRREEEFMPEAMRARNKIYDEYKKGKLPREYAVQALATTRQRFGVRANDNPFFSIKSFDEDY